MLMTNTQLLILATCLVLIYLYWKYYSNKTITPKPDDIIERKGKEKELSLSSEMLLRHSAMDWEINSDHD